MNISKMGTEQLRTAIAKGKFEGEELTKAQDNLNKRDAKKASVNTVETKIAKAAGKVLPLKAKGGKKPSAKKVVPKKPAPKKSEDIEKKVKVLEDYTMDKKTVSGLVRTMLMPKDKTKVAGCSFSEAKAAVVKKFERDLYPSEFDRNFKVLKALGILESKRPPRYKGDIEGEAK